MPEDMDGPDMMREAYAEQMQETQSQIEQAGPDALNNLMSYYRATLEASGNYLPTWTDKDIVEQMALRNAQGEMLN